jgi:SAM-dependent methyltransferase
MKHLLRRCIRSVSELLERLDWHHVRGCLIHARALYDGRRNPLGFFRALGSELGLSVANRFSRRRLCPICGWEGREFSPAYLAENYRPATRCPRCMTCERHRLLHHHLADGREDRTSKRCLVVGPNDVFADHLFPQGYVSMDIYRDRMVDVIGNLEALPFAERRFDIIVCFRVLEHIPDDLEALRLLGGALRPGGELYLSVPLYLGLLRTLEYPVKRTSRPRGPTSSYPDHKRDYAIDDFEAKIRESGMSVRRLLPDAGNPRERRIKTTPHNDRVGRRMHLRYADIIFCCTPEADGDRSR